ncbi:hypothetical protein NE865_02233 [Phthorimaea operculella]|nr:hypothetical protein NE865_02233 [Phthorimaea operculella]
MACNQLSKAKKPRQVVECLKAKDPCKICLQPVTPKNGLRCQGACKSLVHFKCLNYTPGRINDIKAGLITVTCPCPDCKTALPKEYYPQEPFSCNNSSCPANNPPSCENFDCIANEASRRVPPHCPPPGSLRKCDVDICQEYSSASVAAPSEPSLDPCLSEYGDDKCTDEKKKKLPPNAKPCPNKASQPCPKASQPCPLSPQTCPSPPKNTPAKPRAAPAPRCEKEMTREVMQQMCKTVGDLADQLNYLLDHMR